MLKMLLLSAGLLAAPPPLATVPALDLQRYLGTWHEVARYPNRFQGGCSGAKAQYTLLPDGGIEVVNTCVKPDGTPKSVRGRAEVVDPGSRAKLRVSFVPSWLRWMGVGWGDYWVVALADDYGWAIVSEPGRRYLWLLARQAPMKPEDEARALKALRELGFEEAKLIRS